MQLHFLPPYCPDYNRIERLWKDLHDTMSLTTIAVRWKGYSKKSATTSTKENAAPANMSGPHKLFGNQARLF